MSLRAAGSDKRASHCGLLKGSMTVEAAFVLPLFLFCISEILFVFQMIQLQSSMTAALQESGKQMTLAAYYYRYGLSDVLDASSDSGSTGPGETAEGDGTAYFTEAAGSFLLSQTWLRSSVDGFLGEDYLNHTCLDGGAAGISYLQSRILIENDDVDLIADYRIRPFIRMFGLQDISVQSRYYCHAWVGYAPPGEAADTEADEKEEMVFMTETGTVYHRNRGCTYLQPSARTAAASSLRELRNRGGGRYYPCEICDPEPSGSVVITRDGNRYHRSMQCPGLKRNVREVPLSSVDGKVPACSKCGQLH